MDGALDIQKTKQNANRKFLNTLYVVGITRHDEDDVNGTLFIGNSTMFFKSRHKQIVKSFTLNHYIKRKLE